MEVGTRRRQHVLRAHRGHGRPVPVELIGRQPVDDEAGERRADLGGGLEAQREDTHEVVTSRCQLVGLHGSLGDAPQLRQDVASPPAP